MRFFSKAVLAKITVLGIAAFAPSIAALAQSSPIITYNTQFHPTLAKKGMVVSQEHFASEAGLEILKAGGNAVDAAVATGFALAVTHPQAGNLGGGGFMMVYLKDQDKTIAIDYREMAPAAAYRDLFIGEDGKVDRLKAMFSLKSSGTPGSVKGLVEALEKYGTMSLGEVMAPAIKLAEEGFSMPWALQDSLNRYGRRLKKNPASLAYFYKEGGAAYQWGDVFVQPDLAKTLKAIAANGSDGFYKGWVADRIVATMEAGAGLITLEDLANYKVRFREPIVGTFRGVKIVTMPPPSSGGIHIVQMLNVLEGWDLKELGHNSAQYIHRMAETMKYAYADRSKYLGDPDFFKVPIKALTSKEYGASIRGKINLEKATPSTEISPAASLPEESSDTTHFSVVDRFGNMVASTYTLNFTYGNSISVAGAGFLLNNEMDDFSAKPGTQNAFGLLGGEANAIEAGKRPLSSMTPTLVFKDGKPWFATGSPGGSRIITTVLQVILNVAEFDMNIQAATNFPRFHHQWFPDQIFVETGISIDTRRALAAMGQNIDVKTKNGERKVLGAAMSIMITPDGTLLGAADPRRPGSGAAGY